MAHSVTKLVFPIIGGSSSEPANKRQKKEAQRRVQHVGVQGPFIKSKWSHIPITSSLQRLSGKCKRQRTRYMMQHTLFVALEEDRLWHLAK
jgi:hypothetical protein